METQHVPVMLDEVMSLLEPAPGTRYIDGTLGGGGHTAELLARSAPDGQVLGIDADEEALERARKRFSGEVRDGRLLLAHGNFADLERLAVASGFVSAEGADDGGLPALQGVLLDLGFSSDQMEDAQRGFSFSVDGPLDMRLDQSQGVSAADLVNSASEQELADIFWRYGEERRSRQIARRIVRERERAAIMRTGRLAALAAAGMPYKPGTIHPATRVFQALRIAVNAELERLEAALPEVLAVLQRGIHSEEQKHAGRMVIIAFHSLEDRIVKDFLRREATDCLCPPSTPVCVCGHKAQLHILTRKPLTPSQQEIEHNPRARSAKLRAAEVIIGS